MSVLPAVEAENMRLIGHTDLDGRGDGNQITIAGGYAYVGHMGVNDIGTSVVDVSDPTAPVVVARLERPPYTMTHKTQVLGDLLLVNHQRSRFEEAPDGAWSAGMAIFDISTPTRPRQIGMFEVPGLGIHRMAVGDEPYVYVSRTDDGFLGRYLSIIDLSDPARPEEVGRWWLPGQHVAADEPRSWDPAERNVRLHHGLPAGDRLYCGWGDAGFVIIDISDKTAPGFVSHVDFGPDSSDTHTALKLPGRDVVLVVDEQLTSTIGQRREVRVMDVADEQHPRVVSTLPVPPGFDLRRRGFRFGPHNLHEMRSGTFIDPNIVHLTYFAAGLRVYDVGDARHPVEIAWLVPEAPPGRDAIQFNDVLVTEERLVYATDRHVGGLYVIEHES
ncbi:MAG: hypothetical protein OEP52_06550 [Acidimicrobiia bacterium]|nr:hypothetical protein [Acidimicrobiia bacterium]